MLFTNTLNLDRMGKISHKHLLTYEWGHGTHILLAKNTLSIDKPSFFSQEENQRMALFLKDEDKNSFLISHFLKRMVCSSILKVLPEELAFTQNTWGKPHIETPNTPFCFSISHDGPWCAIAASSLAPLGLDIQSSFHLDEKALHKIMHPKDYLYPQNSLQLAQIWSMKEAVVKAMGMGLHYPLHLICLSNPQQNNSFLALTEEQIFHVKFWTFDTFSMALASTQAQEITHNLII